MDILDAAGKRGHKLGSFQHNLRCLCRWRGFECPTRATHSSFKCSAPPAGTAGVWLLRDDRCRDVSGLPRPQAMSCANVAPVKGNSPHSAGRADLRAGHLGLSCHVSHCHEHTCQACTQLLLVPLSLLLRWRACLSGGTAPCARLHRLHSVIHIGWLGLWWCRGAIDRQVTWWSTRSHYGTVPSLDCRHVLPPEICISNAPLITPGKVLR